MFVIKLELKSRSSLKAQFNKMSPIYLYFSSACQGNVKKVAISVTMCKTYFLEVFEWFWIYFWLNFNLGFVDCLFSCHSVHCLTHSSVTKVVLGDEETKSESFHPWASPTYRQVGLGIRNGDYVKRNFASLHFFLFLFLHFTWLFVKL